MCKLTDIVTSLWLGTGKLEKRLFNMTHVFGVIKYPTIDALCQRAAALGPTAMGYKVDMDRDFKQVIMDLFDWPLLGITWLQVLFFDKTAVMGSRSAPYVCQRVTNFIRHIMSNIDYFVANYVDDFMGLEYRNRIWNSFWTLRNLL